MQKIKPKLKQGKAGCVLFNLYQATLLPSSKNSHKCRDPAQRLDTTSTSCWGAKCWLGFVLSLSNALSIAHKEEQGQTTFGFGLDLIFYFHSPFSVGIWSQRELEDMALHFTL